MKVWNITFARWWWPTLCRLTYGLLPLPVAEWVLDRVEPFAGYTVVWNVE